MSEIEDKKIIDKIGICASSLCLIHCFFTALMIIGFPALNLSVLGHEVIHEIFAIVVVTTAMIAVYPLCRKHEHKDIIILAVIGTILILSGVIFHSWPEWIGHTATSLGSLFLISAHYKNIKIRHGKCAH